MSIPQASLENSEITKHFDSQLDFTAQVITDPSQTSTGNYSFTARLLSFEIDKKLFSLRVPIRIISKQEHELLPGQTVSATARVVQTKESRVAALLLVDEDFEVLTPPSRWAAALGAIRTGLRTHSGACFSSSSGAGDSPAIVTTSSSCRLSVCCSGSTGVASGCWTSITSGSVVVVSSAVLLVLMCTKNLHRCKYYCICCGDCVRRSANAKIRS